MMAIGPLMEEIYQNMNNVVIGQSQNLFSLYSAHDTTLMPILQSLQVFDGQWAPYASMIVFELYQIDSEYGIKLIYNGETFQVPGCSDVICPWDEFTTIIQDIVAVSSQCSSAKFDSRRKFRASVGK